jgi:hypothetical protein
LQWCAGAYYEGNPLRFRCQVGHGISPKSLLASNTEMVDHALWNGFSRLDQQVTLMSQLARLAVPPRHW